MAETVTAPSLRRMYEKGERIVCLTAYDYPSALIADAAGVDLVLVGDSMGNVVQGHETTLPVELDEICYHVKMVRRGIQRALLVADLPFGSYNASTEQAVLSAVKLMKAGAGAVKLEGDYHEAIHAIVKAGVPVMGHVGFTPQSIHNFGGPKVQGRGDGSQIVADAAKSIEGAGAFGIVLELIPANLADKITSELGIPTIGIGAGNGCSGEIQVWHDIMGISDRQHKHTKFFVNGRELMTEAAKNYAQQVRNNEFPTAENSF